MRGGEKRGKKKKRREQMEEKHDEEKITKKQCWASESYGMEKRTIYVLIWSNNYYKKRLVQ